MDDDSFVSVTRESIFGRMDPTACTCRRVQPDSPRKHARRDWHCFSNAAGGRLAMQSHTNRSLASLIAVVFLVVTIAAIAAQSNVGSIRGVVTDSSGAVLPGVS